MAPGKKIFIVDDDMMLATMLADHLRATTPHQVSVFRTGEECLAQLHHGPDLVVLDYHLNNEVRDAADGARILERIKRLDRHVQVIMLSGQDRYGVALGTVQKGAAHYVVKGKGQFEEIGRIVKGMLG